MKSTEVDTSRKLSTSDRKPRGIAALLLGAAGLGLMNAPPVHAQEASPPAGTQDQARQDASSTSSDEILVTARRREERLVDVPVALTALTGESLNDYAVTDFTDIATLVPSLIAGRAASGTSASIFLRGVGSTALSGGFDQSVSFVVDGMPMSRGREISFAQYDVAHIEVLKGPQALYYGKNTTGGLISVATNNPTDTFESGWKAGYGFEAAELYGEGYISGPISDTLRARLAVRASTSEGAFDNSAAPVYNVPFGLQRFRDSEKRGAEDNLSGRLTLEYEPSDVFNLQLKLGATRQESGGPTDVLERICGAGRTTPATANGQPPSPNADCRIDGRSDVSSIPIQTVQGYRYARDGKMYADIESQFAILTAGLSLQNVDVTSISSFYTFKQEDLNNVSGEAYPATFSQYAKFNQYSEEIRFETSFDGPLNAMFGAFVSESEFVFNTDAYIFNVPFDPVAGTFVSFRRDSSFEASSLSFFMEGTYDITEQLELSGGARWSREERDSLFSSGRGHSAFAAVFPNGISLVHPFKDENVSPQVTLRWKPSQDISYYVGYREGFKTGGFNLSAAVSSTTTVAANDYDSETAKGVEAGVRAILLDGSLTVNATIYDYLYENLQVQKFDPVTIGQIVANAGELKTRGIEGDFTWDIDSVPGLSLRGAAAYNDAQYDNYIGQCFGGQTIAQGCNLVLNGAAFTSQNYAGLTPPKAPEFAGRLGASYEQSVLGDMTLQFSSDVSYTSEYNFTDTLRPDGVQPAFTKIDASVRLLGPGDRWQLALIGRNLTQEYVVTTANDIPFTGGTGTGTAVGNVSDMSAFVENPREVYVEFALKF